MVSSSLDVVLTLAYLIGGHAFGLFSSELRETVVQSSHSDPQNLGGADLVIVGVFQGQKDVCLLDIPDRGADAKVDCVVTLEFVAIGFACAGEKPGQVFGENPAATRPARGALEHVSQPADIARPIVILAQL